MKLRGRRLFFPLAHIIPLRAATEHLTSPSLAWQQYYNMARKKALLLNKCVYYWQQQKEKAFYFYNQQSFRGKTLSQAKPIVTSNRCAFF